MDLGRSYRSGFEEASQNHGRASVNFQVVTIDISDFLLFQKIVFKSDQFVDK